MARETIKIGLVVIGMTAALVAIGMTAAVIDTNEGFAWGKTDVSMFQCISAKDDCTQACDVAFPVGRGDANLAGWRACTKSCYDSYETCMNVEMEGSPKQPSTGTGSTAAPTSKAGQKIDQTGGVKKNPINVTPNIQSDGGNSVKSKTKNVGKAGGVTNVWENQSSQSTSEGTIMGKGPSRGRNR